MRKPNEHIEFVLHMLLLVCAVAIMVVFSSCSSIKAVSSSSIESKSDSIVYKEILRPVYIPADSSQIVALLECDSLGNVLVNNLSLLSGKNTDLQFTIDSLGNLLAKFKTNKDTIFVKDTSTTAVSKNENSSNQTVTVEVEKPESWFKKFQRIGFWFLMSCIIIYFLLRYRSVLFGFMGKL